MWTFWGKKVDLKFKKKQLKKRSRDSIRAEKILYFDSEHFNKYIHISHSDSKQGTF